MKLTGIVARIKGKELLIRLPLTAPTWSKTGKTKIVASTHGSRTTTAIYRKAPIVINVNAFQYAKRRKHRRKNKRTRHPN